MLKFIPLYITVIIKCIQDHFYSGMQFVSFAGSSVNLSTWAGPRVDTRIGVNYWARRGQLSYWCSPHTTTHFALIDHRYRCGTLFNTSNSKVLSNTSCMYLWFKNLRILVHFKKQVSSDNHCQLQNNFTSQFFNWFVFIYFIYISFWSIISDIFYSRCRVLTRNILRTHVICNKTCSITFIKI